MKVIDHLPASPDVFSVATIGFFDGVHSGHRFLIDRVCLQAKAAGLSSMLITFEQHPRQVMNPGFDLRLLNTPSEKLELLEQMGVDYVTLLPFSAEMAGLTAEQFMREVLYKQCGVRQLLIGHDHRFGCGRSEGFDDYCRYGAEMGMQVLQTPAFRLEDVQVSSSYIRNALLTARVADANSALGYSYFIDGTVTSGYQIGRTIGFPTANLTVDHPQKLIPADGVYAVRAILANGDTYAGMLNIGHRPTLDNDSNRTIEVHLLDFSGDLYRQSLRLEFVDYLRAEVKFDSPDALVAQLQRDKIAVRDKMNL